MPFKWMPAQGNLLALCPPEAFTFTPALDALTPASQLADGRPSTPARFGTRTAAPTIACTLNLLANPGFESADLSDWIVLFGTSLRTTDSEGDEVDTGVASLKYTTAGSRYQDVLIPSGIPF